MLCNGISASYPPVTEATSACAIGNMSVKIVGGMVVTLSKGTRFQSIFTDNDIGDTILCDIRWNCLVVGQLWAPRE